MTDRVDESYRWALPYGSEETALHLGLARQEAADVRRKATRAIQRTKQVANERLLMARNQWYLGTGPAS